MDKLKPILAQKFWIMFAVVLIMPLAGYFMTKGKLSAEITERRDKLNKTFTGIPSGTGVPNDSWTNKLNDTTGVQKVHNIRANQELWLKQKERMFWTKDIAPYMANAEYFKDLVKPEQNGNQVLFKYPRSYPSQIRALWEIVDPLDDGVNLRDSNKRRKVAFALTDVHQSAKMNVDDANIERSFGEIWGAQEDIWLQMELLHAIRRMNENAISQGDASIKQLGKILLFGGTKATGDATASSAAATGGASSEMSGAMMMPFGGGGGGQRPDGAASVSTDINYGEEFDVSKEDGGGGGTMMKDLSKGYSSGGPSDPNAGAAGGAKTEVKRYIDFDEKQAYKRRGFYIKLVMDHRKVPDLLAELMNSPFPVEIVRVQQVWYSDGGASGGGGAGTSPMAGGVPSFSGFKSPSRGDGTDAPMPSGFDSDSGTSTGGGAGRSGTNNPGSAAALADPNLAHVAILGVWTLYLPPPPAADAGQAPPVTSPVPAADVAVTPEKTIPPADAAAETSDKPAATDATADEAKKTDDPDAPKKSDDPDAPKSEPAKPEKSEADSDKPAAEKAPPKTEADDKSDSETK